METLKSKMDLSLGEINQLLDNEKDVNVFKRVCMLLDANMLVIKLLKLFRCKTGFESYSRHS